MNNALTLAQELQATKATDVIRNERVRSQFINVFNSIWKEGGEQVYEREAIYFNQQLREKANLRESLPSWERGLKLIHHRVVLHHSAIGSHVVELT